MVAWPQTRAATRDTGTSSESAVESETGNPAPHGEVILGRHDGDSGILVRRGARALRRCRRALGGRYANGGLERSGPGLARLEAVAAGMKVRRRLDGLEPDAATEKARRAVADRLAELERLALEDLARPPARYGAAPRGRRPGPAVAGRGASPRRTS